MIKRYRRILWDFDGTLADTLGLLVRLYNELAARYNFVPVEDIQAVRSMTLRPFLRIHHVPLWRFPGLARQVLVAQKREMASMQLFPGLLAVLKALRQSGYLLSILSSNAKDNILACLHANAAVDLFDEVIGGSGLLGKGRVMRRWLHGQKVAKCEVLYVGDEVRDIKVARQAGVAIAAVTWGYNKAELLTSHAPDYLIEEPEQLLTLLL
jgi:phosphoglycolate phosphatase-like HAD superfamily hydrolase